LYIKILNAKEANTLTAPAASAIATVTSNWYTMNAISVGTVSICSSKSKWYVIVAKNQIEIEAPKIKQRHHHVALSKLRCRYVCTTDTSATTRARMMKAM